jgi:biotin carboxyl carrier protein
LVKSFIRELGGYGFLEKGGNPRGQSNTGAIAPASHELDAVRALAQSDEERQLLDAARAIDDGHADEAVANYLEAVLQINPGNDAASQALAWRRARLPPPGESGRMQTQERRPTVLDSQSTAFPAAPAGQRRLIVAAVALIIASVVSVGAVVIWSNHTLQQTVIERTSNATGGVAAGKAIDAPRPDTRLVVVEVQFSAMSTTTVPSPGTGVWCTSSVAVGDTVDRDATIGTWCEAAGYARLAKARRRFSKVEVQARSDEVFRYFLGQARASLDAVERDVAKTPVTSGESGRVAAVHVKPGDALSRVNVIAEIESRKHLRAVITHDLVPFAAAHAKCRVDSYPSTTCTLKETGDVVEVLLEDPTLAAPADGHLRIVIAES